MEKEDGDYFVACLERLYGLFPSLAENKSGVDASGGVGGGSSGTKRSIFWRNPGKTFSSKLDDIAKNICWISISHQHQPVVYYLSLQTCPNLKGLARLHSALLRDLHVRRASRKLPPNRLPRLGPPSRLLRRDREIEADDVWWEHPGVLSEEEVDGLDILWDAAGDGA